MDGPSWSYGSLDEVGGWAVAVDGGSTRGQGQVMSLVERLQVDSSTPDVQPEVAILRNLSRHADDDYGYLASLVERGYHRHAFAFLYSSERLRVALPRFVDWSIAARRVD